MQTYESGPALMGKRVLIVEDTPENMRLFRAILRLEDATVSEAANAAEGIAMAIRDTPDVILVDMQMPGMDGLTATRRLRADPRTQSIPIIVVTASAMLEDRERAVEAGCSGYVTKPVDPTTFGSLIASHLP